MKREILEVSYSPPQSTCNYVNFLSLKLNFCACLRLVGVCWGTWGWEGKDARAFGVAVEVLCSSCCCSTCPLPEPVPVLADLGIRVVCILSHNKFRCWHDAAGELNRNAILLMVAFLIGHPLDSIHYVPNIRRSFEQFNIGIFALFSNFKRK